MLGSKGQHSRVCFCFVFLYFAQKMLERGGRRAPLCHCAESIRRTLIEPDAPLLFFFLRLHNNTSASSSSSCLSTDYCLIDGCLSPLLFTKPTERERERDRRLFFVVSVRPQRRERERKKILVTVVTITTG